MEFLIRPLTVITIVTLLAAAGLRVSVAEIVTAVRDLRLLARSMLANLLLSPLAIVGLSLAMSLPSEVCIAMVLMAAAPFAPMVPAFAATAGAHVPMAAGHLIVYSLLAVVVTPLLCAALILGLPAGAQIQISVAELSRALAMQVMAPLSLFLALRSWKPVLAQRLVVPIGTLARLLIITLTIVILVEEWQDLQALGWRTLLAMVLATELCFLIGYLLGGPGIATRRALSLGTGVRNMGVAMLIATGSFRDSPVLEAVIACSMVMVVLGLGHARYWAGRRHTGHPI
jgi:BASS family bile acid:Na+ symporter